MAGHYGHRPRGPKGVLLALRWSLKGLRAAWLHESSFRLEAVLAIPLLALAMAVGGTGVERALLMASVLLVLATELLNSAIEAVIERYGDEYHELAGRAKDMGSAAVFVAIACAVGIWSLISLT